jgi:hypothetical protein
VDCSQGLRSAILLWNQLWNLLGNLQDCALKVSKRLARTRRDPGARNPILAIWENRQEYRDVMRMVLAESNCQAPWPLRLSTPQRLVLAEADCSASQKDTACCSHPWEFAAMGCRAFCGPVR